MNIEKRVSRQVGRAIFKHRMIEEGDRMCYVEPNDCIDCGVCEGACPVGAIFEEAAVPKESVEFTEINALWFEDKSAARARVDAFMDGNTSIT